MLQWCQLVSVPCWPTPTFLRFQFLIHFFSVSIHSFHFFSSLLALANPELCRKFMNFLSEQFILCRIFFWPMIIICDVMTVSFFAIRHNNLFHTESNTIIFCSPFLVTCSATWRHSISHSPNYVGTVCACAVLLLMIGRHFVLFFKAI